MHHDDMVPIIAIIGGLSFATLWVLISTIKSIFDRKQVEQSRREIAAYIAEGTMSPEDGRRLLEIDPIKDE